MQTELSNTRKLINEKKLSLREKRSIAHLNFSDGGYYSQNISQSPILQKQAALSDAVNNTYKEPNLTGLPDQMKSNFESYSGYDLSDVRVTYNSDKPAQLQALAYAQEDEIHLGPGQEEHLGHELWHVVQQKQGRVRPTTSTYGIEINNSQEMEMEADALGKDALNHKFDYRFTNPRKVATKNNVLQPMLRTRKDQITEISRENEEIFKHHLDNILKAQNDTIATVNSFVQRVSVLADAIRDNGFNAAEEQLLEKLYEDFKALSFKSNPILNEAWVRCIDSTRSAAAQSLYGKVGGKFRKKFKEVLNELFTGFPNLQAKIVQVVEFDVNKEHQLNKGMGGLETAFKNLMHAGVGEARMNRGRGTLSELHKELHRMKSGGYLYNFDAVLPDIWDVITEQQNQYASDDEVKWEDV